MSETADAERSRAGAFIAAALWPGCGALLLGWALYWLGWRAIGGALLLCTGIWLAAQFLLRPKQFGAEIGGALWRGAQIFGRIGKLMADAFGPMLARLNANYHQRRERAAAFAGFGEALAANDRQSPTPMAWGKLIPWAVAVCLSAVLMLALARCAPLNPFAPPSGREVAAEARAAVAESETRTAGAEAGRSRVSVAIVERAAATRERVHTQVEEAREAIAAAPDLESRFTEYRSRAQRLRDESAAAVAASVQQHTAGEPP